MASLTQLLRRGCLIRSAFAFLFLIQSIFAFSQSFGGNTDLNIPDTKRIYMKINPLSVLFGSIPGTSEYGLRFEIVANKRFTYQLGAGYLGNTILYQTNLVTDSARAILKQYQFPGIRLQGELRYYFLKTKMDKSLNNYLSPSGMYIALQSSYSTATFSAKVSNFPKEDWTNLSISILGGLQLIHKESFGLDAYAGIGYKRITATRTDYRSNQTNMNVEDLFDGGLGAYLASPIKLNLGFNFTFGLI